MDAIVHVGMHKTGSTSIQQTLAKMGGLGPGHFYPELGERANHSLAMSLMFSADPLSHHISRMQGVTRTEAKKEGAALRESLARQLDQAQGRIPVLSAEYLSSCTGETLVALRDFLISAGFTPKVKAYVRPAADYMRSEFQQRVKGGSGAFDVGVCYPKYELRFKRIERVFGAESVDYWVFASSQLQEGNVVLDFCHRLGLPRPDAAALARSNDSLSRTALALLFQYRRLAMPLKPSPEAFRRFRRVLLAVRTVAGPKFTLSPDLINPQLDLQKSDLDWMSERTKFWMGNAVQSAPDDVLSEAHLLELGRLAFEEQAERLDVPAFALDATGVEKVIEGLIRQSSKAGREAVDRPQRPPRKRPA